jgi:hypothetical protein
MIGNTKMIDIKYSCPETLDNMPKTECGFYCKICEKDVFDFRGKTFGEIQKIKREQNTQCGVFDEQMASERTTSKVQLIFRIAIAAVFVFGFNTGILFSQTKIHYPADTAAIEELKVDSVLIKGTVFNHKKKPIKASYTYYDGLNNHSIETDEKGNYQLMLPREVLDDSSFFYLNFYADEMESQYLNITLGEGKVFTIDVHMIKYKAKNHEQEDWLGFF